MALLEVCGLTIDHPGRRVLDGVDLRLEAGGCLGLVGESGSGKSQLALALMDLLPETARVGGSLRFEDRELLGMERRQRAALRGTRIGMVFQDPMTSLNPYLAVGIQLAEVLEHHRGMARAAALAEAQRMLEAVHIPGAARRLRQYPHELSGGTRQRVMIAMMLLLKPALLIADEPTTALDVTVQAQLLQLLAGLRRDFGLALLLISHDLGVIADVADALLVLYAGRAMEQGGSAEVLAAPRHPYTRALLDARPRLDSPLDRPLMALPGTPGGSTGAGCVLAARCPHASAVCRGQSPSPVICGSRHWACHHPLS